MNTDIRIDVGFLDHWKTDTIIAECGADGVLSLMRIWIFTAQNKPDGRLVGVKAEAIERIAKWRGEPGKLFSALVELHFLERDSDGIWCIHDWKRHNPYAAEAEWRHERAKKANAARRNKENQHDFATSALEASNSTATSPPLPPPPPPPPPPPKEDTLVVVVTDQELSARDGPPPPPPIRIARTPKAETAAFETMRALWAEICGPAGLNELRDVGRWPKKRRDAAWTLWAVEAKGDPEKIRKLFRYVVSCPRLIGGSKPRPGYSEPWRMSFDWLLGEDALARLMEGEFAPAVAAHA